MIRILALTTLFYATTTPSEPQKQTIRAVKEFSLNPLKSVTVTLTQRGQEDQQVSFKRNTDGKQQLSYDPAGDRVTISAQMSPNGPSAGASGYPEELVDKEIHIIKSKDHVGGFDIDLKSVRPKKVVAPKKQQIQAYKPDEKDQEQDWTVVIFDAQSDKISESTFKQNSDYNKAKKLYLQLNQPAVDPGNKYSKYNANIIAVYSSSKAIIAIFELTASSFTNGKFTPGSKLAITKDSMDVVDRNGISLLPNGPLNTLLATDLRKSLQSFSLSHKPKSKILAQPAQIEEQPKSSHLDKYAEVEGGLADEDEPYTVFEEINE